MSIVMGVCVNELPALLGLSDPKGGSSLRVALVLFGGSDRRAIERGDNAPAARFESVSHIPAVRNGTLFDG